MKNKLMYVSGYLLAFILWLLAGIVIGLICGAVGAVFSICVSFATTLRGQFPWLLYLLPVGGLAIVALYRGAKLPVNIGTDKIITSARTQEKVPFMMAPLIFASTFITHLLGGSAGREGAALQLGGSIAANIGRAARFTGERLHIIQLCGMAALFSALFGTPFTAAIFVLEVIDVGHIFYKSLFPCAVSAVTAYLVARLFGLEAETVALPAGLGMDWLTFVRALALGVGCAIVSILFCELMHVSGAKIPKLIKNDYLRIAIGGAAVILLTLIVGNRDYNGAGMDVIARAMNGRADYWTFALKMLFTVVTLSTGFKGGEIVPSFFIGATFGCAFGGLIGLNPALGAAIGLVAVFCGVTNTPAASIILSVEMFGAEYMPVIALGAAVSFMLSGRCSLYHAQRFFSAKLGERENT